MPSRENASANKVAGMRKFADIADEAYDGSELNTDPVDRVLGAFRDNASLAIRFQTAEAEYQRKILGLSIGRPLGRRRLSELPEPPPHAINDASKADPTPATTSIFGTDYQKSCAPARPAERVGWISFRALNRDDLDFTTARTDRAGSSACTVR